MLVSTHQCSFQAQLDILYTSMSLERANPFVIERRLPSEPKALNSLIQTPEGARTVIDHLHDIPSPEDRHALRRYAEVVQRQDYAKIAERDIERDGYSLHLLPGVQSTIPQAFIDEAYAFALEHGKKLKYTQTSDKGEPVNEIVWKLPGAEGTAFVLKLTQPDKMPAPDHELRVLQRTNMLRIPAPRPLGMMKVGTSDFLMMEYVEGRSGQDIWDKLPAEGWSADEIRAAQEWAGVRMGEIAEEFRSKMFIDKPWYIKDFLLTFDGHRITDMFPLDFERAHPYDPSKPDKMRMIPKKAQFPKAA